MRNIFVFLIGWMCFFANAQPTKTSVIELEIQDAWVRATVPQQKATGAFLRITAKHHARLIEASSPITPVESMGSDSIDTANPV